MKRITSVLVLFICQQTLLFAQTNTTESVQWNEAELVAMDRLSLQKLGDSPELKVNKMADHPKAAELGHHLFFDARLSINGKVSCSSCHHPDKYFTDGRKTAKGVGVVKRNAPTIVGINHSNWLFVDGRADSLWSQALQPLEDKKEHGTSRSHVAHVIYQDKKLRQLYEEIFGKMPNLADEHRFPEHAGPIRDRDLQRAWRGMTKKDRKRVTDIFVNVGKAIAAYEMKLNPAPSRFDDYVLAISKQDSGASDILNQDEISGLKLFLNKGKCIICHNGPMFSDFIFHNIATPQVNVKKYDWGRFKGMNKLLKSKFNCYSEYNDDLEKNCDELKYLNREREHNIGLFRTPTLRNVSKTAPYMHAGQYKTIREVIKHYTDPPKTTIGQSDLIPFPIDFDEKEIAQMEAFLRSLDSEIDTEPHWLQAPKK